mgnify:CR=1 FL=1
MNKDINFITSMKALESTTEMLLILMSINKLLIEKGVYTEKEFKECHDKLEKEDEELNMIKQAMAFLKYLG